MSRTAARRKVRGAAVVAGLERAGIAVRSHSPRALAEEAPFSYKDVDEVVLTCERAGLARRVARLRPLGVVKA
jgi:tRNA-splicing ligase RtcB